MKTIIRLCILTPWFMAWFANNAFAGIVGSSLPWEGPLTQIAESLQGPVATSISIIALVAAAVALMFSEVNRGIRAFITTVLGFSIVSSAWGLMGLFGLNASLL